MCTITCVYNIACNIRIMQHHVTLLLLSFAGNTGGHHVDNQENESTSTHPRQRKLPPHPSPGECLIRWLAAANNSSEECPSYLFLL